MWSRSPIFLGPGLTAPTLHFCATIPNLVTMEYLPLDEDKTSYSATIVTTVVRNGGYCEIPEEPGLGISLVEDYADVSRRWRTVRSRTKGCSGPTGRSPPPTESGSAARRRSCRRPGLKALAVLRQWVAGESQHLHCHVGPQRQARYRLVQCCRVSCRPDAAVSQLAGYPPDRPQCPGSRQEGPPFVLGLEQLFAAVRLEVVGKANVDGDKELHVTGCYRWRGSGRLLVGTESASSSA